MWDGIILKGNHVSNAPNILQAYFHSVNSSVQRARKALYATNILTVNGNHVGSIGGRVYAINTIFKNNAISFTDLNLSGSTAPNNIFRSCTFEQTNRLKEDDLSPNGLHKTHIGLFQSNNTFFENCIFRGLESTDNNESYGILAYRARVNVGLFNSLLPPETPLANTESRFENLNKGIGAHGTGGLFHRVNIQNTNFDQCVVGISTDGNIGDYIINNSFNCTGPNIVSMSSQALIIAHNRFSQAIAISPDPAVVMDNSEVGGGQIFQNDFSSLNSSLLLSVGVWFEQNNTALSVLCNTFQNFDLYTSPLGSYARAPWIVNGNLGNQGTGCGLGQTAGNLFFDVADATQNKYHIWKTPFSTASFAYYANELEAVTVPVSNSSSITVDGCPGIPYNPNSCPKIDEDDFIGMINEGKTPGYIAAQVLAKTTNEALQVVYTNQVLHSYFKTEQPDSILLAFLAALNTAYAQKLLMQTYSAEKGNATQAQSRLSALSATQTLPTDYENLFNLLQNVKADNRQLSNLTEQEAETLNDIAQTNSSAGIYAQSIQAYLQSTTWFRNHELPLSGKNIPFQENLIQFAIQIPPKIYYI